MAKRAKRLTQKAERARCIRNMVKMIQSGEFQVVKLEGDKDGENDFRMNTKAGPLFITVYDNWVHTRFDYAQVGEKFVGASVPSGKWNHHFPNDWSADDAVVYMRAEFRKIKPTTLEKFQDDTALLPHVIAETAMREAGVYPWVSRSKSCSRMVDPAWACQRPDVKDYEGAVKWFSDHCAERLIQLWDMNQHFRKRLESATGRDVAYAFVHHWLDAYLDCPPKYRDAHSWQVKNYDPMPA